MLQTLCFIVNVDPFHPENLGEHAVDQVMAKNGSFRDFPSFGSELNPAALSKGDTTVSPQPLEGGCYCRWRHGKPMSKECGDYGIAFRLGLCNGLQIIFLGNGDHHDSVNILSPLDLFVGHRASVTEQAKDNLMTPAEPRLSSRTTLRFTSVLNYA